MSKTPCARPRAGARLSPRRLYAGGKRASRNDGEPLSHPDSILALVDDLAFLAAELYFEGLLDGLGNVGEESEGDHEE